MPLTVFSTVRPTFQGVDADTTINQSFVGRYCYVSPTVARSWTLDGSFITTINAEIDIRVDADAAGDVSIEILNGTLNISGDLGNIIPAGGIGELKRRGSSSVFDFYGYITA